MPTNTKKKSPTLSHADLIAAQLQMASYQLPSEVTQLPADSQKKLLSNPLAPVSRRNSMYHNQRELLKSLALWTYSSHLRSYCRGLCELSPAAWRFVVNAGKPNYGKVPAARAAGTINDMDASAITNLYVHWIALQNYAGLANEAPTRHEFASVRTAGR